MSPDRSGRGSDGGVAGRAPAPAAANGVGRQLRVGLRVAQLRRRSQRGGRPSAKRASSTGGDDVARCGARRGRPARIASSAPHARTTDAATRHGARAARQALVERGDAGFIAVIPTGRRAAASPRHRRFRAAACTHSRCCLTGPFSSRHDRRLPGPRDRVVDVERRRSLGTSFEISNPSDSGVSPARIDRVRHSVPPTAPFGSVDRRHASRHPTASSDLPGREVARVQASPAAR